MLVKWNWWWILTCDCIISLNFGIILSTSHGKLTVFGVIYGNYFYFCKWVYERSYMWAAEKDMNLWLIIGVVNIKPEKKIKAWTGFEPWPLRHQCSALPTEISSHLGAGHVVSLWYIEGEECRWIYERSYIWFGLRLLKFLFSTTICL